MNLLVPVYLREKRNDEAFATIKRLTSSIPHELVHPILILDLAQEFSKDAQFQEVIDIFTMFLGNINRFWDKDKQVLAYRMYGMGYINLTEYEKATTFPHKALSITEDPSTKVDVLGDLAFMQKTKCNYGDALAILNQALDIISAESGERNKSKDWSEQTASIHGRLGDVLSDWGECDLEALDCYECALGITKEHDHGDARNLASFYLGLGLVHARLGNWDEAMKALKLAIRNNEAEHDGWNATKATRIYPTFCDQIWRVLLDQYCSDDRLLHDTQEREKILKEVELFSKRSIENCPSCEAYLNYAQANYFLGKIEDANFLLYMCFEFEMQKEGVQCRSCFRQAVTGAKMKTCKICEVVDYCSKAHQRLAWRRGRLSHKVMCPFFKRYRMVAKAANPIDTEPFEDFCKEFFETVCVLKYEV